MEKLIEKKANLVKNMQIFLDERDADGNMCSEDVATYERMEKDYDNIENAISRRERLEKLNSSLNAPTSEPLVGKVGSSVTTECDNFAQALRTNDFSRITNTMSEQTDGDGKFLVPDEWANDILEKVQQEAVMRKLCDVQVTNHGQHKMPIWDDGADFDIVGELEEFPEVSDTVSQKYLEAYKLGGVMKVSDELREDNTYNLMGRLNQRAARKLSRGEDKKYMLGTGVSSTPGVKSQPSGVFVPTIGGDHLPKLTAALTCDDVINLIYKLRAGYANNASFLLNRKITRVMRMFKDNEGRYLWQPSLQVGQPNTFDGYPIYESEFCPLDKIAFGDFKYYKIGDRKSIVIKPLLEKYATQGATGILVYERTDGKLAINEAVKILELNAPVTDVNSGGSTKSKK